MGLSYEEDNSLSARIRREMRNPSLRTIAIVVVTVIVVVSAPFVPTWVNSARTGIADVTEDHDLTKASTLPKNDLTDEQVALWMAEQGQTMIDATNPLGWKVVNFRFGPCSPENLGDMAQGPYATTVVQACASMADIHGRYQRDCFLASSCNVKDAAKDEIRVVIDVVLAAHSDAGYVQ